MGEENIKKLVNYFQSIPELSKNSTEFLKEYCIEKESFEPSGEDIMQAMIYIANKECGYA